MIGRPSALTPHGDKVESIATSGASAIPPKLAVSHQIDDRHLLGGVMRPEAGITVLARHNRVAPPTVNLATIRRGCDPTCAAREASVDRTR
jgi:hypothetical protein